MTSTKLNINWIPQNSSLLEESLLLNGFALYCVATINLRGVVTPQRLRLILRSDDKIVYAFWEMYKTQNSRTQQLLENKKIIKFSVIDIILYFFIPRSIHITPFLSKSSCFIKNFSLQKPVSIFGRLPV